MTRWTIPALLLLSLGAAAQLATNSPQPSNAQSASVQPVSTNSPGLANAQPTARTPASADQVIDQMIEREHALITYLSTRKPIVETYLQNLVPDSKLGAVPKEDHYFLGRLDMGESIERRDFLASRSFQKSLMGGVTNLFRIQYQPMGFSWMVFADRLARLAFEAWRLAGFNPA